MEHVNYPHEAGRLIDCPACEAQCHCTPGTALCVWEGHRCCEDHLEQYGWHEEDCEQFDPAPTHQWEVTTPEAVYATDEED